jgi:hypothetical protein
VNMLLNYTANSPNGSGSPTPFLDNDGDANNTNVRINLANAKSLGLVPANDAPSDASITFSSNFTWDFDPRDGITGGVYDFVGAATHEIGHALGFASGVDVLDINSSPTAGFFNDDEFTFLKPLDLYRYSAESLSAGGGGTIDWTADTRDKYFSLDGGATSLGSFSTGTTHGDGRQASHWKDNLGLGIMDPTFAPGELGLISNLDRRAFDVMGWTPNNAWSWIDPAGGGFAMPAKWASTIVPGPAQSVIFDLSNTYTITLAAPATAANTTARAGDVTLALGVNPYTVSGNLDVAPITGDVATLRFTGSGVAVKAAGLTIGAGGKLDLTTTNLVVDYSGPTPAETIRAYLTGGRNGGTWDGPGIDSSAIGASAFHALGYAEASEALALVGTQTALWNGQTVDATSVLVKYTYGGDATLDGKINVDDYGRIDFNIGLGTSGWFNGDFNYDGKVNVDDYGIIDLNVGIQGPPIGNASQSLAVFAQPAVSAVPEPTSATIAALVLSAAIVGSSGRSRKR